MANVTCRFYNGGRIHFVRPGGPGSESDPLPVLQAAYNQKQYYLENEVKYLCFNAYKGTRTPSELVNHNFAVVEG